MITLIAAIGKNNELGKDNQLIWKLSTDLKRFKNLTTGHVVIMGRKTYESMNKPLPNRTNIVITRNPNFKAEGCIIVSNIEEALKEAEKYDENPYIVGGGEIYRLSMDIADVLEITHVHHSFDADAFFPEISLNDWEAVFEEDHVADAKNEYDFSFITYQKK
ncbi:dihydrofolate reductase [Aureivirga marina]|uniref:dihydrofolate reductase n=1 Tax=Aureivirga marina TaxID=1182451 RepID=UPI0018CBB867|nr:dihydrofolate reductase [Aureivirga marina]